MYFIPVVLYQHHCLHRPSGDGLHMLYKLNDTPNIKTNKRKFDDGTVLEVYFNKRYFTITGNVYNSTPIATVTSGDL